MVGRYGNPDRSNDLNDYVVDRSSLLNIPTPSARDARLGNVKKWHDDRRSSQLDDFVLVYPTAEAKRETFATPNTMDCLPPKSSEALRRESLVRPGRSKPNNLRDQILNADNWPTPRANDAEKRGNVADDPRNGLVAAIQHYCTPTASNGCMSALTPNTENADISRLDGRQLTIEAGNIGEEPRYIHHDWECWLMGWPVGWCNLEPLPSADVDDWLGLMLRGGWNLLRDSKGEFVMGPKGRLLWDELGMNRSIPAEEKPENWKEQIKMLGNGQVPLCTATAWMDLTEGWE